MPLLEGMLLAFQPTFAPMALQVHLNHYYECKKFKVQSHQSGAGVCKKRKSSKNTSDSIHGEKAKEKMMVKPGPINGSVSPTSAFYSATNHHWFFPSPDFKLRSKLEFIGKGSHFSIFFYPSFFFLPSTLYFLHPFDNDRH
jgi:hypothetical protein